MPKGVGYAGSKANAAVGKTNRGGSASKKTGGSVAKKAMGKTTKGMKRSSGKMAPGKTPRTGH